MRLLLAVGLDGATASRLGDLLGEGGPTELRTLPLAPSRSDLDGALGAVLEADPAPPPPALVLAGPDAGLNAVVTRLLRRGVSDTVPVALLPGPDSAVARVLGLPTDPVAATRVALTGAPVRRGLVRDDHGGVLLAGATLGPWTGRRFGARSYLDATELANRRVRRIAVRPGDGGLRASVSGARLGRPWSARAGAGRAVTVSCEQARLVVDGVVHPRPQTRRTWWYQPDLWQVVLPG